MADVLHGRGIRWMIQCVANNKIAYYLEPDGLWLADAKYSSLYSERPSEERLNALQAANPAAHVQPVALFYDPELSLVVPSGWKPWTAPKKFDPSQLDNGEMLHSLMVP